MNLNFLEFEQPIAELEAKIDELHYVSDDADININDEIKNLKEKSRALTKAIFSNLTSWQISQLARHPQRPYAMDYIQRIFTDFEELHGDRHFADDHAIIGGLARLDGAPVMGRVSKGVAPDEDGREIRHAGVDVYRYAGCLSGYRCGRTRPE
jgi:acetyl-CoA carboxylase carboxyl transferase subunit alpha